MNIRIKDENGKVTSGAMENGKVIQLHSSLKAAVLVMLDIYEQDYLGQSFESFVGQVAAALRMEQENRE